LRKQTDFLKKVLVEELLQDKLISDIDNYEFRFREGRLYINGKKQSNAVYKKYKELYEKTFGKILDDTSNFTIVKKH
jgi:hypothetical protein